MTCDWCSEPLTATGVCLRYHDHEGESEYIISETKYQRDVHALLIEAMAKPRPERTTNDS